MTQNDTEPTNLPQPDTVILQVNPEPPVTTNQINANPTSICPICFDDSPSDGFVKPLGCSHNFCKGCVTEYLNIKIKSFQVLKISCPYSECQEIFTEKAVELIIDEPTFKTYQEAVLKKLMNRNSQTIMCPKPGCLKQLKPSQKKPYTKCACKTLICNTCCNPWHEGKTCLEVLDPSFEAFAREENIRFCMICKSHVQRVEGCKHITCPICDYEWCWDCGREYKKNHQAECKKEWCPAPPLMSTLKRFQHNWLKGSLSKKICYGLCLVLLFPLLLLQFIILWPLWIYCDPETDLSIKRPFKSLGIILLCAFLGILLSPVMIGVCLTVLISHIIFLPFGLITDTQLSQTRPQRQEERQQREKRWLNKDPVSFVYTSRARPGVNEEAANDGRQIDLEANNHGAAGSGDTQRNVRTNDNRIWGMSPFTGIRVG